MVRLSRIFRDYHDAGSLNSLLALWGFLDDSTFMTKAGHVGLVYRLAGVDHEGLTHAQRQAVTHQFESAVRLLDERCRVYQYLIKRTADLFVTGACAHPVAREAIERRTAFLNERRDRLYRLELYLVLLYEGMGAPRTSTRLRHAWRSPRAAWHEWLSRERTVALIEHEVDRSVAALHHKAHAFEVHLDAFRPQRLAKKDAFGFFRQLVNYDAHTLSASRLLSDAHLDYFVADSPVECHRDQLVVGGQVVKMLSMKEPPAHTFAGMLHDLTTIPGNFVACLEWQRIPGDRMRRDVRSRRRHFFNQRVSLVNYVAPDPRPEEMLVDDSAAATVRQLGDALSELEVNGHFFGFCSLTLALHGPDVRGVDNQVAEALKTMALHDGAFFEETYNLLNAWLGTIPGNGAHNLRRLALLETNLADLSFLFLRDQGEPVSAHLQREALAVFETPHQTPYAFNLHVLDVGHTLVLGATGSGKSFLLNFLVTHAQKYDPITVILDLGNGYRKLATLLGGRYLEVGLRQRDVTMNPFALAPTPEHLHFLHAFVRVLLDGDDGYRLSELEDREVYEAIENLYVLDRGQRRLFTLANLLPRSLAVRLHKWIDGGRYADLFDHVEDTLSIDSMQVVDFASMRSYPSLLEPLLFYVLHRVTTRMHNVNDTTRLNLCVLDEAWKFIQHPMLHAYAHEGLKTGRHRNTAMVLATQSIDDFASADLLRTVVESCPTKLLLPNPAFDRKQYVDLFQLNERELELVAGLLPRQQLLLKRPDLTKVLTLAVDPKSYWIYTNTPVDNDRVTAIFRECGFEAGLDRLAASA